MFVMRQSNHSKIVWLQESRWACKYKIMMQETTSHKDVSLQPQAVVTLLLSPVILVHQDHAPIHIVVYVSNVQKTVHHVTTLNQIHAFHAKQDLIWHHLVNVYLVAR